MELLLNLVWLLLVLPAFWLLRHSARARGERRFTCILALGCMLVLLFPVISATDDLHAMRAEMEEPGPNKRGVRPSSTERSSNLSSNYDAATALAAGPIGFRLGFEGLLELQNPTLILPVFLSLIHGSRAPPAFVIA